MIKIAMIGDSLAGQMVADGLSTVAGRHFVKPWRTGGYITIAANAYAFDHGAQRKTGII